MPRILIANRFRFVDDCQPQWIQDLWQSNAAEERSSAFFAQLACAIERLQERSQSLFNDKYDASTLRRDSSLAIDFPGKLLIDSYQRLSQWLASDGSEQAPAIDGICQSEEQFRSWAASFMAEPDYFTVEQTDFAYVCKTLLDSGYSLERHCLPIYLRVKSTRENYIRSCQTGLGPNTLRSIIALRLLNISTSDTGIGDPKSVLPSDFEEFDPIPASILDVSLAPNQLEVVERLLPQISNLRSRKFYRGICLNVCSVCRKPRFQIFDDDVHPLFRALAEFPKDARWSDCIFHRKTCSSCRFKRLIRDICQEWWHGLVSDAWLKRRCSSRCSITKFVAGLGGVKAYIQGFVGVDPEKLYKAVYVYEQVLPYRHALKKLQPRPEPRNIPIGRNLFNYFLGTGLMQNFMHMDATEKMPVRAQWMSVTLENNWRDESQHRTYQVPIFLNLLRRQRTPKECIVCAEDKLEVDYGSWTRWQHACADYKGPWTWRVLEFPIREHQQCTHSLDICQQCMSRHIAMCLNNGNFERITCPQCDRVFAYDAIKNLCSEEIFKLYDKRVLLHTLGKLPNFRWCLSSHCDSGQVYDDVDVAFPCVQCQYCHFQMCFYHERPWHDGISCKEHDSLFKHGDPKYRETQIIIEEKTKGCPKCNVRIEKGPGCFHMTCSKCKHEFCWECLVSWHLVTSDRLNHKDGCFFQNSVLRPTAVTGIDLQTALQQRR